MTTREMKPVLRGTALILLSILMAGCNKDDYRLAFSHNLHVTENDIACADCHGKMAQGRFAIPGHAACKECHGDWIETKAIKAETCGMCHKAKDLQVLALDQPAKPASESGKTFMHTDALAKRCADCHGAILDKKLKRVPELTHKEKIRIRDQAHQWGMSCAACHEGMDPKTPPPSHGQNWTRRHGTMGTQPDNACSMCHTEQSCRECHQVTMPASHNNLWRLKTHGIKAAWDRERCLVCHQQDSCDACHASNRPQSHNAGWRQNHCFNCHPSRETGMGCTVCHETDIGSHPNPHAAGWRSSHCNNCHLGSPEVQNCGVCHGFTTLNNHPNPHSVGWRDNHCYSCHVGSASADQCAACHSGGGSVLVHQGSWPPFHDRFASRSSSSVCYQCHNP